MSARKGARRHTKLVTATLWAIKGRWADESEFLYCGTWITRHDAITAHCEMTGVSWAVARKRGNRAVRVLVRERAS